jgi:outer membrane protein assembly factor BamB
VRQTEARRVHFPFPRRRPPIYRAFPLLVAWSVLCASACGSTSRSSEWPLPHGDLESTRAAPDAGIGRGNVARLEPVWRYRFAIRPGESGAFTATPVVADDVVYLQDMDSNVGALDLQTGARRWLHRFRAPSPGPNGLAVVEDHVFGATDTTAFALSSATGRLVWQRRLVSRTESFVDTAPTVANGRVYLSTTGYNAGTRGALYALDAETGSIRWRFGTIRRPWRYPAEAGGGGAWQPPSVGADGRVYWGTGNPFPFGGTPRRPNGGSFPGPALYTDSLIVLESEGGQLAWFDQVTPHDIRDYDFQLSPILAEGRVFGAGKAGLVIAWDPDTGRRVWQTEVGLHRNDRGALPRRRVRVCPGLLGGVETAMAYANGRLFVPVVDLCSLGSAIGYAPLEQTNPAAGRGELVALDAASGRRLWTSRFPQPLFGCATAGDGVVFVPTFDGALHGLDSSSGATLWTARMRAGVNACPALADGFLLVGAGVPLGRDSVLELVAYSAG